MVLFNIVKDCIIPKLMLMKANGHGYLLNNRIYDNRVGVVHHYINLYGAN